MCVCVCAALPFGTVVVILLILTLVSFSMTEILKSQRFRDCVQILSFRR